MNQTINKTWIQKACELAENSVDNGTGPFGAIIIDKETNQIVAEANNTVTQTHDPTAHAEINAIRKACEKEKTHVLDNHILYTSSYPCSMCLPAIYWAKIPTVIYANSIEVASSHGFDDSHIHTEIQIPDIEKSIKIRKHEFQDSDMAFKKWDEKIDKILY